MVTVFQQLFLITTPTRIVNYGVKTTTISHFKAYVMLANNRSLTLLSLIAIMLPVVGFAASAHEYKVADKRHNGDLVINGMAWRPSKVCSHINKGDKVVFKNGNQNGHCVSATIVKGKDEKACQLWCDI